MQPKTSSIWLFPTITMTTRQTQTPSQLRRGWCARSSATRCSPRNHRVSTQPTYYTALKTSKSVVIEDDEHDVFGDGSVIIKLSAWTHARASSAVPQTATFPGSVVLSGDLYHFPETRALKRLTIFDFDQTQTTVSREAIEAFLAKRVRSCGFSTTTLATAASRRHRITTSKMRSDDADHNWLRSLAPTARLRAL